VRDEGKEHLKSIVSMLTKMIGAMTIDSVREAGAEYEEGSGAE